MNNLVVSSGWWNGIKDDFAAAGVNTVVGLCVVFVALIFISFVISLFKYINKWATKNDAAKAVEAAPAAVANAAPAIDNFELAAVVSAAITEFEESRGNHFKDGIVIRKITRIS